LDENGKIIAKFDSKVTPMSEETYQQIIDLLSVAKGILVLLNFGCLFYFTLCRAIRKKL
jgi:hypothetical protein